MASSIESYVNQKVSIITADGINFVGTLKGFDQNINIILDDTHERVYSSTTGVEQVVLGLHIVRGDKWKFVANKTDKIGEPVEVDWDEIRRQVSEVFGFKMFTLQCRIE